MTESNKQKLERIKIEARHDDLATPSGPRAIVVITPNDYAWLLQEAERAEQLETELKETIAKKNRHLKDKDKRIKKLEWSNMIHKNGHGRIYAELHELKESVKRGGDDA